jgi:hypothetical protein
LSWRLPKPRSPAGVDLQGDPTAALQVYASLCARLAEELRLKPCPETEALAQRIRAAQGHRGAARAHPAPTVESRAAGELVAPPVGRHSPVAASSASESPLVALGNVLFACTEGQPLSLLETLKLLRGRQ